MILSDNEIIQALNSGKLKIDRQISVDEIAPSSLDLHLGRSFVTFPKESQTVYTTVDFTMGGNVDPGLVQHGLLRTLRADETLTVNPGDFILAFTQESIELSNDLAARIEGRSSLARAGISVHQTAPTVHATFRGQLRLEISHNGPYRCILKPGIAVCQLILERLGTPATGTLQSHYQGQSSS
jgi:dCTP deaminase